MIVTRCGDENASTHQSTTSTHRIDDSRTDAFGSGITRRSLDFQRHKDIGVRKSQGGGSLNALSIIASVLHQRIDHAHVEEATSHCRMGSRCKGREGGVLMKPSDKSYGGVLRAGTRNFGKKPESHPWLK